MGANVPERDELGRFMSWAKKKGGEAVDNIKKNAGGIARSVSVKADEVADKLGAPPQARDGMDTDDELETAERHMMKKTVMSKPDQPGIGMDVKPKYKPWTMEKKKGF